MLDEAGRGEGKGCIPSNTSQATIDLCDCSVGHNGILIWTANPTIIFIRKVNLLNGLSTFDCFIDSWLTWNTALRVGVLLVRNEVRHWQVTRMNAYVLCSDGNSNSNSSWLMTHPPPLLSPFLFFLTKTNSYSQLTTKRTHKRAYMVSAHFVYHDCPMSQLLSESLFWNACDTLISITSRLFASLPQMDRITVMSVLPLHHIWTNIVISFKFWCITSVIFYYYY